jgi:hypothetical protein
MLAKSLCRAAVGVAATLSVLALTAPAHAQEYLAAETMGAPASCHRVPLRPAPAGPDVQWVEVCSPSASSTLTVEEHAPGLAAGPGLSCTCVSVYSPMAGADLTPLFVRVSIDGVVVQQQYPFANVRLYGPAGVCVVSYSDPDNTATCLL